MNKGVLRVNRPSCPVSLLCRVVAVTLCAGSFLAGCATDRPGYDFMPPPQTTDRETLMRIEKHLAGKWEYEDKYTIAPVLVTLDERGNGPYEFREGFLYTINLTDHLWEGWWYQRENDREGGFEVILSDDFSEGAGYWWYTRIGTNTDPEAPGEKFQITRMKADPQPIASRSSHSVQNP